LFLIDIFYFKLFVNRFCSWCLIPFVDLFSKQVNVRSFDKVKFCTKAWFVHRVVFEGATAGIGNTEE